MSTCQTQVFVSQTQCDVIEVCTPGPQGPTGPIGPLGPTGPGGGATGPTGPPAPISAPVFNESLTATVPSGQTDNFSPFGYVGGTTNALLLTPADTTSTLLGLSSTGAPSGYTLLMVNESTTISIQILSQQSGTTNNQFNCRGDSTSLLPPLGAVIIVYISGQGWYFT